MFVAYALKLLRLVISPRPCASENYERAARIRTRAHPGFIDLYATPKHQLFAEPLTNH